MKKTIIICIAAVIVAGAVSWFGRGAYDKYVHYDLYSKLSSIESVLDKEFLYDYDKKKSADYAALAMSMSLEDPYTVYYNREQFEEYMNAGTGDYVGIGVTVVQDKEKNEIQVISVVDDSPGFEAGILPGDVILAVEGEKYDGSRMNDAVARIREADSDGKLEGTFVNITIRRNGEEKDVSVERRRIHQDTVKYEMLENNIGLIRISAFHRSASKDEKSTEQEFAEATADLMDKGMRKLIIDVRDNGGGDVGAVTAVVDSLVPEGLIMYTIDKKGNREEVRSDKSELDLPMAVLVNGNTASAAELLTGALRDYGKATVIGTKTFGKGVMQQIYPFSDGSGMSVTIARYYTPDGICVQDEGITPDIISEQANSDIPVSNIDKADDVQLRKAIDILG